VKCATNLDDLMKVMKRDLLAIAAAAAVIVVLIMVTVREKAKPVPADDKHRAFYEAMEKGGDRVEVERACITCHNSQAIPLPKKHPPKEQCLICHKLNEKKQ
jgi:cytochrome c5